MVVVRHGHEIDCASGVGADHHWNRLGKSRNHGAQKLVGQKSAHNRSEAADQKDDHESAGALSDFPYICLKEQHRDRERNDVIPDKVVGLCLCRDDVQVCQQHGSEQCQHAAGHFRCPAVMLLEIDCGSGHTGQHSKQCPAVVCRDQCAIHPISPSRIICASSLA